MCLSSFTDRLRAFKDFGARFMAQCFRYFSETDDLKTLVLVATSGDTGGAIASSFCGMEGIDVIILYPSGKGKPPAGEPDDNPGAKYYRP